MELNDRQQGQYEMLEKLVEQQGKFEQADGPDGAHYMPPAKNPFVAKHMVCSNCAFWRGPDGCEIVEGRIEPEALCKLWIIPEERLSGGEEDA